MSADTGTGKVCEWTEDEDGVWSTECGGMFTFNEGSPADNEFKFCCYCGKPLAQCSYQAPPEDDT